MIEKNRLVYIEGDLSDQDKNIITNLLTHRLVNELGYWNPGYTFNVMFIVDKEKVFRIFKHDTTLYGYYSLPASFSEDNFLAFRINGNKLEDIRQNILDEIKQQR